MNILDKAIQWTKAPFDTETQNEIQSLIDQNNTDELNDRFYKDLEFGTGGMRGIMGAGTNRMNKYTYGKATQGLANYIKQVFTNQEIKVAIGYDCRHNSDTFSKLVADVLTANNIKVFLFESLRPTPELSFAVRHLSCQAGIVLTASHNPPEYNGFKVYWQDGGQIVPPEDNAIIKEVNNIKYEDIKFNAKPKLLEYIGKSIDQAFYKASVSNGTFKNTKNRNKLKIVFTSLHGTSIELMPEALRLAGYEDVHIVEQQQIPDGNFPTVKSPNPEEPAALKMALDLAEKINADIVLGTDPDSDRIGIAVRNNNNHLQLLNGNQTMVTMTNYLLKQWQSQNKLTGNEFIASTIVSTDMMQPIADNYNVELKLGLTGFKWIAKMIKDTQDKQQFIGGGEESFGYMVGDFNRDKDAITSGLLACEIAANAKANNSSFYNELLELYIKHGYYKEHLISIVKKGMTGSETIKKMMINYRENPIKSIDNESVEWVTDYQSSIKKNLLSGTTQTLDLPKANVLIYHTTKGTKICIRPSGTEPKIKFYFSVNTPLDSIKEIQKVKNQLDEKINRIIKQLELK